MLEYNKTDSLSNNSLIVPYMLNIFKKHFDKSFCLHKNLIQSVNLGFNVEIIFKSIKFITNFSIYRKKIEYMY